ncbi:hypothetical protein FA95DRAFT_1505585, partial [Auriscalpium vulgare]
PIISWDIVSKFSMSGLAHTFQKHAPITWQVVSKALNFGKETKADGYRPSDIIASSIISELVFGNNSWTNLMAISRSLVLFGTKANQTVYRVGSRLAQCVPYSTVREALVTMSTAERTLLMRRFADPDAEPPIVLFDNIQNYDRVYDVRMGRDNKMITGCMGTSVKMEDCPKDAFDIGPIQANIENGARRNVTATEIMGKIDDIHIDNILCYHWADVLVSYVPSLALYRSELSEKFEKNTMKHQINKQRHTKVFPLGTNSANEASTKGVKEAIADFLHQLGIKASNIGNRLIFFHGDGKTFDGIHKMKKYVSGSRNTYSKLRFVRPVLELWHTKWTDLSRICRTHWGGSRSTSDPSSLGFMAKAINVASPTDFHKVHFYNSKHLVDVVTRGHILQRWEAYLKTNDLVEYYRILAEESHLPSLHLIIQDAAHLSQMYSTSQAHVRARMPPSDHADDAPRGPAWPSPPAANSSSASGKTPATSRRTHPEADWVLANSILLLRDGIYFLEVCRAVKLGDIGRVWEMLKKIWVFTFAGAGNTNYTAYLIEMFINIEREYPKATRDALFNNWLVNLEGKPGHFHELDLMQEHFNKWLEEHAQHTGKQFDDPWYRNVLSMHVHQFLRLTRELEKDVHLEARRKSHTEPHKDNELREVIRICHQHDLHLRRNGRDFGHHAQDDFSVGYRKLGAEGKLEKYIKSTLQEWHNTNTRSPLPTGQEDASTYLEVLNPFVDDVVN